VNNITGCPWKDIMEIPKPLVKTPRIGKGILTHKEVGVVLKIHRKYVYMFRFEVKGE
jgi:hypothetical protein